MNPVSLDRPASAMMSRRSMVGGGAALASAGLGGCVLQGPRYRYRYKLTLQVLADGVMHTGVNVVQVEWRLPAGPPEWRWPGDMSGAVVKGAANVVDLGRGRLLVALLTKRIPNPGEMWEPGAVRSGWGEASPEAVLARAYGLTEIKAPPENDRSGTSPFLEALCRQRGPREIGTADLPTLVTFRDALDPLSVEQVDPTILRSANIAHADFTDIRLEITDIGFEYSSVLRKLPWIIGMKTNLAGENLASRNDTLPKQLSPTDFLRR